MLFYEKKLAPLNFKENKMTLFVFHSFWDNCDSYKANSEKKPGRKN